MKKSIYKYTIDNEDCKILMPIWAEILCVQTQKNKPQIWALIDPDPDCTTEYRHFEVFATGEDVNIDIKTPRFYIGTFQLNDGELVFHLFERIN